MLPAGLGARGAASAEAAGAEAAPALTQLFLTDEVVLQAANPGSHDPGVGAGFEVRRHAMFAQLVRLREVRLVSCDADGIWKSASV